MGKYLILALDLDLTFDEIRLVNDRAFFVVETLSFRYHSIQAPL